MSEIKIPIELQRPSYTLYPGQLPHTLSLPHRRSIGTSVAMENDIAASYVPSKYTHVQRPAAHGMGLPVNQWWYNVQSYTGDGGVATPEWLINNTYLHPDIPTASELTENWFNHALPNRAEEVYQGWYNRMKNEYGVTSPNQTKLYSDYWLFTIDGIMEVSFTFFNDLTKIRAGMASREAARKVVSGSDWGAQSAYFNNAVNYRNILMGGYQANHWGWREGQPIYNMIYNFERHNLAFDEYRRLMKFFWVGIEGIQSRPVRAGGAHPWIRFPGGRIYRRVLPALSFKVVSQNTFWALLLGDDAVYWNVSGRWGNDIHKFVIPAEGPGHDSGSYGNIRWKPDGGSMVTYNPSDPSHPVNTLGSGGAPLGFGMQHPETGAHSGAWWLSQISGVSDRISHGLRYAPFRYRIGSGSWQIGYFDGNNPVNGSLGNARVSEHGTKNFGQDNVARSWAAAKPLCIYGSGVAGGCIIFYIAKAPLTETITIEHYVNSTRTHTCVGPGTHVFYD